ncbi:MAG: hypothetical protein GY811_10395 [Myxococcales bacterium]|nr:hypothetical protein [Myxococcales bacterium]
MKNIPLLPVCLVLALQAFGCDLYTRPPKDLLEEGTVVAVQSLEVNRKLDLLFVIDDSGGMREEQDAMAAAFPSLLNELQALEGGLPDLHIAVVSTNLGAGPYGLPGCEGQGDNGVPRGTNCVDGAFLADEDDGNGGRTINYEGTLADTFSCMARVGTDGCGFEQPLDSMRRALDRSLAGGNDFLRTDAQLGVIFLTDEDDCSVFDVSLYDTDVSLDRIDSTLGFLSSYRCFEFGVECEGDTDPRSPGTRQGCRPKTASPYLYDVQEYVRYLQELKTNPSDVFVAGIIGTDNPVEVTMESGEPTLAASCEGNSGSAMPPIRLQGFLNAFGRHSTTESICSDNLSSATTGIGAFFRNRMAGSPCLHGPIRSPDACIVEEVRGLESSFEARQAVAVCDDVIRPANSSTLPCYLIEPDPVVCSDTDTQLRVRLEYGNEAVPADVDIVVTCPVEGP